MTRVSQTVEPATLRHCINHVERAIAGVFDGLRSMGVAMEQQWEAGRRPFTADDLVMFQPCIFEQLDAQPAFDSAGYVMSEHALADRQRYLDWWHRAANHHFQPLILNLEPGTPDCYDYYTMDWFLAAVRERRRFISGPHIDLPCADVCIMTFTDPVVADGGRDGGDVLGVAGADVALSRFESLLLPPLRRLAAPAVLVNSQRRVITSNDAAWISGEKLPAIPSQGDGDWQAVAPVMSDLGWTLAVLR